MHAHGIAAEQRMHKAALDEPADDVAAAGVQHGRADHPNDMAFFGALLDQQLGHACVVNGLFAADSRTHELEFAFVAILVSEQPDGVYVDAFTAIFGITHGHLLTALDVAAFDDVHAAIRVEHDRGIHARAFRQPPLAFDFDVG